MSDLESVERKLYSGGVEPEKPPAFLRPTRQSSDESKKSWGEENLDVLKNQSPNMKKTTRTQLIIIGVSLGLLGVAALGAIFLIGFQRDNLQASMVVEDRVEAGERITYHLTYKNQGNQTLKNLELSFTYPSGAVPLEDEKRLPGAAVRVNRALHDLKPGEQASINLEARLFGKQDDIKKAEGIFFYQLDQSSARFSAKVDGQTTIARVPIVFAVDVPNEVISGQTMTITIDYTSSAQTAFDGLSLGVDYPDGFQFVSAVPAPQKDNAIWVLGTLPPGGSGHIVIQGIIIGSPGDAKIFNTKIGTFDATSRQWALYQLATANAQISTPLLSIEQLMNESRDPIFKTGDQINLRLHYKNVLDIPLKNVAVEVSINGEAADLSTLHIQGGVFDGSRSMVVFNSASLSAFSSLAPHSEGDLNFDFKIKGSSNPIFSSGQNVILTSIAHIFSSDHPQGLEGIDISSTNTLVAKMSTRSVLSSRILYHTDFISTSGPLPPKVKEKTTYAVIWQLSNSSNDLTNVEVHATLLPGVSWENTVNPASQSVSYDQSSSIITWRVGTVKAGSGISTVAPQLAFKIGFVPGPDQVGKSPTLVKDIELVGVDAFTHQQVYIKADPLTTELRTDPASADPDWKVAQ